jgi:hypothetical protein
MIALAAPDVDLNLFVALAEDAKQATPLLSFYYSHNDWAVYGSEEIHTMNRAGRFPVFIKGMDTINADRTSTGIGHNYFSEARPMILDLSLQIYRGSPPEKRNPPLSLDEELSKKFGRKHWIVDASPSAKLKK